MRMSALEIPEFMLPFRRGTRRGTLQWLVLTLLGCAVGAGGVSPSPLRAQDLPGRPTTLQLAGGGVDRTLDDEILPARDRWARLRYAVSDEDQPLTTHSVALDGGLWLFPWLSTEVETGWIDANAGPLEERALFARATVGARWDPLNLEGAVWGGGFRRARVERGDWSGGGVVRYVGPSGLSLQIRSERDVYLGTRASLTDSLTATLFRGEISRRSRRGWAGRISFTEALLSNENRVHDAQAWVLAPVVRGERAGIRAGYSLRAADSDESSFVPREPRLWDPAGRLLGTYAGAYTPEEIVSHAAILQLWYDRPDAFRISVDGSWGVHAREDHPILVPEYRGAPDQSVDLQFERRRFTPWDLGARSRLRIRAGWFLDFAGGYLRSAFQEGGYGELGAILSTPRPGG